MTETKKKPYLMCVMYDDRDPDLSKGFINSIRKFHSEDELPIVEVKKTDEKSWNEDPNFYYRAKALIAMKYINDYENVIVADADQLCLGDLSYVFKSKGWDIGVVLNWNRVDPETYGVVTVFNINPQDYFNAGLIAFRSKEAVEHLANLCHGRYFDHPSMRYREQDLLNIMCHYGNYTVKCFDIPDQINGYHAWHGLISKGEGVRMKKVGGDVILPPDESGYPAMPVVVKIWHYASGGNEPRNHRLYFDEPMISYIDWLISDEKDNYEG